MTNQELQSELDRIGVVSAEIDRLLDINDLLERVDALEEKLFIENLKKLSYILKN